MLEVMFYLMLGGVSTIALWLVSRYLPILAESSALWERVTLSRRARHERKVMMYALNIVRAYGDNAEWYAINTPFTLFGTTDDEFKHAVAARCADARRIIGEEQRDWDVTPSA